MSDGLQVLNSKEVELVTNQLRSCFVDVDAIRSFLQRSNSTDVRSLLDNVRFSQKGYAIDDIREHGHAAGILGDLFLELAIQFRRRVSLPTVAWHFIDKYQAADNALREQLRRFETVELDFSETSLEGLTSFDPFLDLAELESWCGKVKKRVCQIRCAGKEQGTGFLIAPDLVLTCFHVIASHIDQDKRSEIELRFDYHSIVDGSSSVENLPWLKVDSDWEIPHAKYSSADVRSERSTPSKDGDLLGTQLFRRRSRFVLRVKAQAVAISVSHTPTKRSCRLTLKKRTSLVFEELFGKLSA